MNIQTITTYELTENEVKNAIYDAFVQKLKGLNVNAFFDTHSIKINEYGDTATLTITENSEI